MHCIYIITESDSVCERHLYFNGVNVYVRFGGSFFVGLLLQTCTHSSRFPTQQRILWLVLADSWLAGTHTVKHRHTFSVYYIIHTISESSSSKKTFCIFVSYVLCIYIKHYTYSTQYGYRYIHHHHTLYTTKRTTCE